MRPLATDGFSREYKNPAEKMFSEIARKQGWRVSKRGWPDFICMRKGEIMLIEVKPKGTYRLKSMQEFVANLLKTHGINVCRWSPDNDWLSENLDNPPW